MLNILLTASIHTFEKGKSVIEFKSYNPSDENIRETLEKDVLGRNKDIVYDSFYILLNIIINQQDNARLLFAAIPLWYEMDMPLTYYILIFVILLPCIHFTLLAYVYTAHILGTEYNELATLLQVVAS